MARHLVELDPAEFMCVNPVGSIIIRTPPYLTINETQCAGCDSFVGFNQDIWQDTNGGEHEGLIWTDTWVDDDGHYFCEDCAGEDRGE